MLDVRLESKDDVTELLPVPVGPLRVVELKEVGYGTNDEDIGTLVVTPVDNETLPGPVGTTRDVELEDVGYGAEEVTPPLAMLEGMPTVDEWVSLHELIPLMMDVDE
jgi:hypothetical protein